MSQYNPVRSYQIIDIGPKSIPSGTTQEYTASSIRIRAIRVVNPTAGAITIRVFDLTSPTPIDIIPTVSVPAGGWLTFNDAEPGTLAVGGIQWTAGGAGLTGYMRGGPV